MRKNVRMSSKEKYIYAMELLNQYNIETTDNVPTYNNHGDLIFHSKQLKNVIHIHPQATKKTIKAQIDLQIKIAKE